ncbi:MAG: polysaccharide biosynthesis tyrosine autokinase [Bacteroidota bacterium]
MNRPNPATPSPSIFQKWLIQKLLLKLMHNWQWITLFAITSLAVAFLTNRYANKIYMSQIKVVKGNEDVAGDGASFVLGANIYKNILNTEYERAFFTSTPLLEEVVQDLNLLVTYYSKGYVRTYERFGDLPITVVYDRNNMVPYDVIFRIATISGDDFTMTSTDQVWKDQLQGKKFTFGREGEVAGFRFTVKRNYPIENRGDWMFKINRLSDLTNYYKRSIRVDVSSQYGQVAMLRLSIQSPVPEKDIVVLNRIVEEIRDRDVQRKVESSGRTLSFIDEQLASVTDTMEMLAGKLRDLKMGNRELSAGSSSVFERISNLEEKKAHYLLSNRYCQYLSDYIRSSSQDEIIVPSVLGIENEVLNNLVSAYINLRLEERSLAQLNLNSRVYQKELEQKELEIKAFEDVMMESIASTVKSNNLQVDEADMQIGEYFRSARSTLSEEIVYNDNERLYSLNEKVFTLLMDKKAVAGITRAALISDYRSLEPAWFSATPLQPRTSRNYLIALLTGLLIPVAFFFQRTLARNNLLSLAELEELINLPIVGMIGNNPNPTVVRDEPRSLVAENFRSLRSNLRYLKEGSDRLVLLITSSITEEGKSFVTSNLGYALALQGKKTIVIGADLRKPTLQTYFGRSNGAGLSEYLSDQADITSIINKSDDDSLFYIHSGPVPPNPAELISGKKMSDLIQKLREEFEYVLIDTPPVGTISDAVEIYGVCDAIILVTRQGKTPVVALQQLGHFFDRNSLAKTVVLFNGVKVGGGSGYYGFQFGYGYGYGDYYRS